MVQMEVPKIFKKIIMIMNYRNIVLEIMIYMN
jgi:hypothetical protein